MDQSSPLKRSAACLGSSSRSSSPCSSSEKRAAFGDYHHAASVSRSGGSSEPFITSSTTQKPAAAVRGMRTYKRSDLAAFNLLANRPIWVFDVDRKEMWWGNDAAFQLWNASSLQALLDRDFSDMSESTCKRLNEYMAKFQRGERVSDRWTYYPKGQAVTVDLDMSGVYIDNEDGSPPRLAMLNDGQKQDFSADIDKDNLRSVEIMRHLPVAVGRFDVDGSIIAQNPEALSLFGSPPAAKTKKSMLLERFVDRELGQRVLKDVVEGGGDCHIEAQQHTVHGPRWFAIDVRRSRDPITANNNILYSAQDITSVMQAKKEANAANSAKSELFAILAHEIRTPLHQVNGFIELMGQTTLTEQQSEYISLMESSSLSMMCVINDLLDYTKLSAGQLRIESIPFNPTDVASGTLAAVAPKAKEKGLELRSNLDTAELPNVVIGDPNRLRQLLMNFLNNSLKFTHIGAIALHVSKVVDDAANSQESKEDNVVVLEFAVVDTGIGLSSEHMEVIFNRYHQGNASITREYGGTGLGLAICKNLTEAMGGTIGVHSEVGKGAKFWFRLSFETQSPLPPQEVQAVPKESVKDPADSLRDLHVLVVEDSEPNQKLVAAMLRRWGHSVSVVENGLKAVEAVQKTKFDLVLMDVQMPVMDGLEATRVIRGKVGLTDLPVVGLTANYRESELQVYQDVGMNDCIAKPVRMDILKAIIYDNVARSRCGIRAQTQAPSR